MTPGLTVGPRLPRPRPRPSRRPRPSPRPARRSGWRRCRQQTCRSSRHRWGRSPRCTRPRTPLRTKKEQIQGTVEDMGKPLALKQGLPALCEDMGKPLALRGHGQTLGPTLPGSVCGTIAGERAMYATLSAGVRPLVSTCVHFCPLSTFVHFFPRLSIFVCPKALQHG